MAKPYRRVQSDDRVVNQIQDNLQDVLNDLVKTQILNNLIIKNVELASGTNTVNHKLGRKPQGYIIIRKDSNVSIWDNQTTNTTIERTLELQSSGTCNVDILVF